MAAQKRAHIDDADLQPFSFEWTIKNFTALRDADVLKELSSDSFNIRVGKERTKWQLMIRCPRRSDHVSFYLRYIPSEGGSRRYFIQNCSFALKSTGNRDHLLRSQEAHPFFGHQGEGYPEFISTDVLDTRDDLVSGDTLRLVCTGDIIVGVANDMRPRPRPGDTMMEPDSTIMTLVSDGKEIPIHKLVLQARSPVFEAMFNHDMVEKRTGRVVIPDVGPPVLEAMVHFLYTDEEPPNMSEVVQDLLVAADKYDLARLKTACERHLARTLETDNVVPVLHLAIEYHCQALRQACLAFAHLNVKKLTEHSSWPQTYATKYPAAMCDLINCLF